MLLSWLPNIKRNQWLVELDVADVLDVAAMVKRAIDVIEDPLVPEGAKCANPAHALIDGMPFAGAEQGEVDGLYAHDLLSRRIRPDRIYPALGAA